MDLVDHFIAPAKPDPAKRRRLVVVLHGFGGASANRLSMVRAVAETFPEATIYAPELPYRSLFCDTPLVEIVARLAATISDAVARDADADIVLVGHSTGAMVARKLVLAAWGVAEDVAGGDVARPWAGRISRLVFLAAVNRGWSFNSAIGFLDGVIWVAGVRLLQLRGWIKGFFAQRRQATILQIRRGSSFLAMTRLQWLELMADPKRTGENQLTIVQTIGTVDDIVSPDDAVDHVLDSTRPVDATRSSGTVWARFFMLEMCETSHLQASSFWPEPGGDDGVFAKRRAVLRQALTGDADALIADPHFIRRRHMEDDLPPRPDIVVEDVVFVIHGIRDKGFWTKKIARKVKEHARRKTFDPALLPPEAQTALAPRLRNAGDPRRDLLVRSVTASYGYFPMAPFILRWLRQEKVEWLLDLYVETKARYPRARLHYVGHSNGTYLLAGALACCPRLTFEHVVFAGSVVRRDYAWTALLGPAEPPPAKPRVKALMNYVATGDWVVAIFPNALQRLRALDLGSAGHDGFAEEPHHPRMLDIRYVEGNHSAGIRESQWDEIADFILDGKTPFLKADPVATRPPNRDYVSVQDRTTIWVGKRPWLVLGGLIFVALVAVPALILALLSLLGPLDTILTGVVLMLYGLLLKAVLTRV